jgi:uncharacterized coiled-coil DUF342 family protein
MEEIINIDYKNPNCRNHIDEIRKEYEEVEAYLEAFQMIQDERNKLEEAKEKIDELQEVIKKCGCERILSLDENAEL